MESENITKHRRKSLKILGNLLSPGSNHALHTGSYILDMKGNMDNPTLDADLRVRIYRAQGRF